MEYFYDKLPSHCIEALYSAKITGTELRVMLLIGRMSYGYQTRAATLTTREIAETLDIEPRIISRAVARLKDMCVLQVANIGQAGKYLAWNEAIEQWQCGGIPAHLLEKNRSLDSAIRSDRKVSDSTIRSDPTIRGGTDSTITPLVLQASITAGITSSSSSALTEFLQSIGLTEEEANRFSQPTDPIVQGSLAKARTLHEAISARSEIKYPAIYLRTILNSGKLKGQYATLFDTVPSQAGDGVQPHWWQNYGKHYEQSEASNA